MNDDYDSALDLVKRRLATDPAFRRKLAGLLADFDKSDASIETYFDRTLKSPRLRALFEQSRANSKDR